MKLYLPFIKVFRVYSEQSFEVRKRVVYQASTMQVWGIILSLTSLSNPTIQLFHIAQCTILFWKVHCGIWNRCIVGFVKVFVCWSEIWQNGAHHIDGRITIRWQSVVQKWWKMKLTIEKWEWIPPNNQLLGYNSPKYFLSSCNGCEVMYDCIKALFRPKYGVRTLHTRLLWHESVNSTHI